MRNGQIQTNVPYLNRRLLSFHPANVSITLRMLCGGHTVVVWKCWKSSRSRTGEDWITQLNKRQRDAPSSPKSQESSPSPLSSSSPSLSESCSISWAVESTASISAWQQTGGIVCGELLDTLLKCEARLSRDGIRSERPERVGWAYLTDST